MCLFVSSLMCLIVCLFFPFVCLLCVFACLLGVFRFFACVCLCVFGLFASFAVLIKQHYVMYHNYIKQSCFVFVL